MTQTPRDWQKDMKMFTAGIEQSRKLGFAPTIESSPYQVAIHWLQEAKERGEREQRLEEAMNKIIIEYDNPHNETGIKAAYKMRRIAEEILSTLYPDTPAEPVDIGTEKWDTARPIEEWHEDIGPVLWWTFPIEELPYCGSPLDVDWPGYHTHWTPFIIPFTPDTPAPAAPKEGNS